MSPVHRVFDRFALKRDESRIAHRISYSHLADMSDEGREGSRTETNRWSLGTRSTSCSGDSSPPGSS